jgi:glycerol-3-phosphate dehydrogenase
MVCVCVFGGGAYGKSLAFAVKRSQGNVSESKPGLNFMHRATIC